ncbi:hypothetical protein [Mycobacterium sp.]|uniref:hypothetical protein n=1 Tax=Mycobacterium sp. TaxID=1785 RepID=UPI0026218914|nr:hypothetical protein [Mycobacterium sp.]
MVVSELFNHEDQVHRTLVMVCASVDLRRRDLPRREFGECPHHGAMRVSSVDGLQHPPTDGHDR